MESDESRRGARQERGEEKRLISKPENMSGLYLSLWGH